jgi:hypothetical protein
MARSDDEEIEERVGKVADVVTNQLGVEGVVVQGKLCECNQSSSTSIVFMLSSDIAQLCGILDVNSFEIPFSSSNGGASIQAVYRVSCLTEHRKKKATI